MDSRFKRCLDERKIVAVEAQPDLIKKGLKAAENDLKSADSSAFGNDYKWATVQAYYSMFHTAKALVLGKGYREKSHACLLIALKTLFVDERLLESRHFSHLMDSMHLREDAGYGLIYSEESSEEAIGWAREFLADAQSIMGK